MEQITAAQIHAEFRSALQLSTIKLPELLKVDSGEHQSLVDLGMINSKNYQRTSKVVGYNQKIAIQQTALQQLQRIETTFPQYRIISLSKVMELMLKYNLVFGSLSNYIETIPKVNLDELRRYDKKIDFQLARDLSTFLDEVRTSASRYFIVAPKKFFKPGLVEVNRFLLDIEKPKFVYKTHYGAAFQGFMDLFVSDPIVLRELSTVSGDNEIYLHICTAWDVEAEDESVTTEIKNRQSNN